MTGLLGTVITIKANYYLVNLDQTQQQLLCICRSRLKKIGEQVYVGDRVEVEEPDWQGMRGAIGQILPRVSMLDRPRIANVDRVLLVFSLAEPGIEPLQLSRFLVAIAYSDLPMILCLNKADLVSGELREVWRDRLQTWGYQPIITSTHTDLGIEQLKQQLETGITVIAGASGVGKSSLINHICPQLDLRIGEVSGRLRHGRHTTRHVQLFPLDSGLVADTPGFIQPDFSCTAEELAQCFPEAKARLAIAACQFHNCTHRTEPGCVVRGDWERYDHYLSFWQEVSQQELKRKTSYQAETGTKLKSGQAEPILATKKHRRPSRRRDRQSLGQED
ncbi:MAG: ribosome small subunit-dependent GTPase A [Pseudanabaenaceae cyanobacterium bins.68]|nr:ribosome small subunit-dependent GTPase A [Pseudanabaenaceae cyanobacterium bins.68]